MDEDVLAVAPATQRRPTLNRACYFTSLYIPTLKFIPALHKGMHYTFRLCALNIQYLL